MQGFPSQRITSANGANRLKQPDASGEIPTMASRIKLGMDTGATYCLNLTQSSAGNALAAYGSVGDALMAKCVSRMTDIVRQAYDETIGSEEFRQDIAEFKAGCRETRQIIKEASQMAGSAIRENIQDIRDTFRDRGSSPVSDQQFTADITDMTREMASRCAPGTGPVTREKITISQAHDVLAEITADRASKNFDADKAMTDHVNGLARDDSYPIQPGRTGKFADYADVMSSFDQAISRTRERTSNCPETKPRQNMRLPEIPGDGNSPDFDGPCLE